MELPSYYQRLTKKYPQVTTEEWQFLDDCRAAVSILSTSPFPSLRSRFATGLSLQIGPEHSESSRPSRERRWDQTEVFLPNLPAFHSLVRGCG